MIEDIVFPTAIEYIIHGIINDDGFGNPKSFGTMVEKHD